MTRIFAYLFVASVAIGCKDMNTAANIKHAERIRALANAWKNAEARRDLDGMMAIYSDDARELLPGMPAIVGRDSIRAFYERLIHELPRFKHEFDPQEFMVAASGDVAVVRGEYRFAADTLRPAEIQTGKFMEVWVNIDQDWRLRINMSSGDSAAYR